jgi:peroxiredoxin
MPDQDRDETGQAATGTRLGSDPKPVVVAEVGKPAPDLTLTRSDGRPMRLASVQGKPTVIVFGSFSCPAFRQRVPAVNSAAETLGNKINLLYVYTREAHPVGQWEVQRNLDENIRIDAHKSLAERLNQARQTQTSLKLAGQVVVDDMDDRVSRSFDGFPNGAVVLDRDGVVVLKQKWCDPSGWQAAIDEALARPMKR